MPIRAAHGTGLRWPPLTPAPEPPRSPRSACAQKPVSCLPPGPATGSSSTMSSRASDPHRGRRRWSALTRPRYFAENLENTALLRLRRVIGEVLAEYSFRTERLGPEMLVDAVVSHDLVRRLRIEHRQSRGRVEQSRQLTVLVKGRDTRQYRIE